MSHKDCKHPDVVDGYCWYCGWAEKTETAEHEREMAELEAQVAALREALDQWGHDQQCAMIEARLHAECDCNLEEVLKSTASTAREYEERIRAEEREACAKVANGFKRRAGHPDLNNAADIAAAIRARKP